MEQGLVEKKAETIIGRRVGGLLLCVPLAVLAWSFAKAPYVAAVGELRASELPIAPNEPILLYRDNGSRFYYTASDLLMPEAFGKPGQFINAVVYDVLPTAQAPTAAPEQALAWNVRIWKALAGDETKPQDMSAAEGFRSSLDQGLRIDRGAAKVYAIPSGSSYRAQSGISHFAALGIRIPDGVAASTSATAQLFPQAIQQALDVLGRANVAGVGVPRMMVRRTLGEAGTHQHSWSIIVAETGAAASGSRIERVVFGGWGILPEQRSVNDAAFRAAWTVHRGALLKRVGEVVHEPFRLGALLAFAALLAWRLRNTPLTWRRVLALALLVGSMAYAIAQAGAVVARLLDLDAAWTFALEAAAALLVGGLIEQVVRFDPKKVLAGKET
jgi:hypothetical protein